MEAISPTGSVSSGSEPPVQLDYASPPSERPVRPLTFVVIPIAAVLAGVFVGFTTNAINGIVSPIYFTNVMGWQFVSNIWRASVEQGVFEGSIVGVVLGIVLTITIAIVTRATCTPNVGLRWLAYIMLSIYGTWALGGICGVTWAAASPSSFSDFVIAAPVERTQLLRFAWVGGSIWGAEPGGLLVVIIALILFRARWRRMLTTQSGDGHHGIPVGAGK